MRTANWVAATAIAMLLSTGCGRVIYTSGPFTGRVVDADTKAGLSGAAVVMFWQKEIPIGAHRPELFVDAVEVLTDRSGEFKIPRRTDVVLFGWMQEPYLAVYYPGYGGYPSVTGKSQLEQVDHSGKTPSFAVELRKLITLEERRREAGLPVTAGGIPEGKMPNLMRLVNRERKELGLDPIGGVIEPR